MTLGGELGGAEEGLGKGDIEKEQHCLPGFSFEQSGLQRLSAVLKSGGPSLQQSGFGGQETALPCD